MSKLVTPEFAASLIKDGMSVGMGGFVGFGTPEEALIAIEKRYLETGEPKMCIRDRFKGGWIR